MYTLTQHLMEAKNTHLAHLEDEIFLSGSSSIPKIEEFLGEILQMFHGNSSTISLTTKWDGAPAVFVGTNPENGKFFVGTKSVFNKSNPKINYSNADIDANHPGDLGVKLKLALKYLPELKVSGIIQGDYMFSDGDLKNENIDGKDHVTFTPNTITYAIDSNSNVAKEMKKSKIGIVFHTTYNGSTMADMTASFSFNKNSLKKSKNVWYDDANFSVANGVMLDKSQHANLMGKMKTIKAAVKTIDRKFLDEIQKDQNIVNNLLRFTNKKVRENQAIDNPKMHVRDFIKFAADSRTLEKEKLKSDTGKAKKEGVRQTELEWLRGNSTNLTHLFDLHKAIAELKVDIVDHLNQVDTIRGLVRTKTGYDFVGKEGIVAIDQKGNAVKLTDRLTFNRLNFLMTKAWK